MARPSASARLARHGLRALSALTDTLLTKLWALAALDAPNALLAVGGYGRSELFPHSDVDVLVLLPDDSPPDADDELKRRIELFIGACWDAGLEIGSSVRTLSTCLAEAQKDVTVQTALLENRHLAGSAALTRQFQRAFLKAMDPKAFLIAKTLELRQRHHKFENTPYSLEPNCKESPGGLRDLHAILWVAKAAQLGNHWDALAHSQLATPFEVKQIKRNESVLIMIRSRLHLIAGRREDRLIFDMQNAVAESFGYKTVETVHADGRKTFVRASEALMKRY